MFKSEARKRNGTPGRVNLMTMNTVVLVGVLLCAIPFVYMISASFRREGDLYKLPVTVYPREWTMHNFHTLFDKTEYVRWYGNTIFTASIRTVLGVYLAAHWLAPPSPNTSFVSSASFSSWCWRR